MRTPGAISRKGFVKRLGGGAVGAAAVGDLVRAPGAAAASSLDATYSSPYPPYPVISHPSAWPVYTGLTYVVYPYQVFVSSRPLTSLGIIDGWIDPSPAPSDATILVIRHYWLPAGSNDGSAPPLNGTTMRFTALGGGSRESTGFRRFGGIWSATWDGNPYGLDVILLVGPNAGRDDWSTVQPIVDSVRLAG
jgi:hypothetical protein